MYFEYSHWTSPCWLHLKSNEPRPSAMAPSRITSTSSNCTFNSANSMGLWYEPLSRLHLYGYHIPVPMIQQPPTCADLYQQSLPAAQIIRCASPSPRLLWSIVNSQSHWHLDSTHTSMLYTHHSTTSQPLCPVWQPQMHTKQSVKNCHLTRILYPPPLNQSSSTQYQRIWHTHNICRGITIQEALGLIIIVKWYKVQQITGKAGLDPVPYIPDSICNPVASYGHGQGHTLNPG